MKSTQQTPKPNEQSSLSTSVNDLLYSLLNTKLQKGGENSKLWQQVSQLFDKYLWLQKHEPALVAQIFDMGILQQIQDRYIVVDPLTMLRYHVIIMMNCCQGGLIAMELLDRKIPNRVLNLVVSHLREQDKEEAIEYLGSFLKAYHRIFTPNWLEKFIIHQEYFQLLEVCFHFYNCPEQLTRTTVINIVLDLLSYKGVQEFIEGLNVRRSFYEEMATYLCQQFRNQLGEYNLRLEHISKEDTVEYVLSQLEDKISLWEDLSRVGSTVFRNAFVKEVLMPLLVGAIRSEKIPLFTLKFSLLTINKLIPTLNNFSLLSCFVKLLFFDEEAIYYPSTLFKAMLKPFSLQKLIKYDIPEKEKEFSDEQEDQKENFGSNIKLFVSSLLKTKDNHFLLMISALLSNLIKQLHKEKELCEELGFDLRKNGKCSMMLAEILISQLSETHRLNTILSIINTLLVLTNFTTLENDSHNLFIYIFRNILNETKTAIKAKHEHWDYLLETVEYDIAIIDHYEFDQENIQQKYEKMYKIVFTWDKAEQEQENDDFYLCIPDTQEDHIRYLYVKFLIMLRGREILLEGHKKKWSILEEYYEETKSYKCKFLPGQLLTVNQLNEFYPGFLYEQKNKIPILLIPDPLYFIIGYHDKKESNEVKIMTTLKTKHIQPHLITKKDKIYMQVKVRAYNSKKSKLEPKSTLLLRGFESKLQVLAINHTIIRENELTFMIGVLKKVQSMLPDISLL